MNIVLLLSAVLLSFLLLGWRVGGGMILSVFSLMLLSIFIILSVDVDAQLEVQEIATTCVICYVLAMWIIGAIWRLMTYKRIWNDFKKTRLEQREIKMVLNKYQGK